MKGETTIRHGEYTRVVYSQFNQSRSLVIFRKIFIFLSVIFLYPFILLSRISDYIFRTISELLSLIPFLFGTIIREAFYKKTLSSCGDNVFIAFGTVFHYRDISLGSNVLIGLYTTVHHCDIGSDVLIADGCRLLSGSKHHDFHSTDVPMTQQGGWMKHIKIGNDVWVGANSVITEDVPDGCVIGASSVVTKRIEHPYSVLAGAPAKILRQRGS